MSANPILYKPPAILREYHDLLASSLETLKTIHIKNEQDVSKELLNLYQSYIIPLIEQLTNTKHPSEIEHYSAFTDATYLAESKTSPLSTLSKAMKKLRSLHKQGTTDLQDLSTRISILKDEFLSSRLSKTLLSLEPEPKLSDKEFIQKCSSRLYEKLEELQASGSYPEAELTETCTYVANILRLLNTPYRARKIENLIQVYDSEIKKLEQQKSPISNEEFVKDCSSELHNLLGQAFDLEKLTQEERANEWKNIRVDLETTSEEKRAKAIEEMMLDLDERIAIAENDSDIDF